MTVPGRSTGTEMVPLVPPGALTCKAKRPEVRSCAQRTSIEPCGVGTSPSTHDSEPGWGFTDQVRKPAVDGWTPRT